MLELENAVQKILEVVGTAAPETVPLNDASRRIAAEDLFALVSLPSFTNSAMDGYAVRSTELTGASPAQPVALRVADRIAAGDFPTEPVRVGNCVRLFTGSPLPPGTDAVVMQEDTRISPQDPATVLICAAPEPGENVRFEAEDVAQGSLIVSSGQALNAASITLLAAAGISHVPVTTRPSVGLISTGSELRVPGQPLRPGQIYESNRIGLAALARQAGAIPVLLPPVVDDQSATRAALECAFSQCDLVVTSGGVSVGEFDLVKGAFEAIGGTLDFWRVAIKPGRPFVLGRRGKQVLFGLPGNPVSAFVTFLLLVRPALLKWQGATDYSLPSFPALLAEDLHNPGPRRHFVRVKTDHGLVHSAGTQASHCLGSLGASNGLVDVPAQTTLRSGQTVQVLLWD